MQVNYASTIKGQKISSGGNSNLSKWTLDCTKHLHIG